jgi:cytoplasmic iron level regulating protein YaaA (DUF328/UPF0246 family)
MLIILSPAKTLDFTSPITPHPATKPVLLHRAAVLNEVLRELPASQLIELMDISQELAELNERRNLQWRLPFTRRNARQALFAFRGDVYTGLDADTFSDADIAFAQQHLRILSGLYGVLRPLDLMQAYRLEMGTALHTSSGRNLYQFWGDTVTQQLNKALRAQKSTTMVNLASEEYFGVVKTNVLNADVVTPVFKDYKNGVYKVISFFAKKARGAMAAWLIRQRITDPAQFMSFAGDGYAFSAGDSTSNELVFLRRTES